jgi:hypothetical protein
MKLRVHDISYGAQSFPLGKYRGPHTICSTSAEHTPEGRCTLWRLWKFFLCRDKEQSVMALLSPSGRDQNVSLPLPCHSIYVRVNRGPRDLSRICPSIVVWPRYTSLLCESPSSLPSGSLCKGEKHCSHLSPVETISHCT